MTNSQNSGQEPPRSGSRRRRLLQVGCATGVLVLGGVAAGGWWAWRFIHRDLAPLVASSLSDLFNRPVQVGDIESVTLTSLTLGESAVPPTQTDPDRLTVPQVKVNFNPLELLWDRTLSLDVTLDRPVGYVEQDEDGLWISTKIKEQEQKEQFIKIELDTLRVKDGTVRLAPYIKPNQAADEPPIPSSTEIVPRSDTEAEQEQEQTASERPGATPILVMQNVNAAVTFREDNKLIGYDITAKPETGGNFRVKGATDLRISQTQIQVTGRELLAADIGLLLPLPLKLQAGLLSADLGVVVPEQVDKLQMNGTVRFRNAVARLEALPKPFTNGSGALRFQGQQITFQEVRGRYGAVNATVRGSLNLDKGYNLTVNAPQVSVADLLQTFDVEESAIPIALTGNFKGELKVGGAIDQPLITGVASNTNVVQVDRVTFDRAATRFTLNGTTLKFDSLEAVPTGGGLLAGTGQVTLGDDGGLVFDIQGQDLPGDTIASAYGASSANFTVGRVDATAQVFGSLGNLDNLQTLVRWQAPQATYPGRGEVAIVGSNIRFRDTVLLVAGGLVRGEGEIANGLWRANVIGSGVELSRFSPELRGLFGGNLRLSGSLANLSPSAIQAEGDVSFSEGIAIINDPLTASVRWLGDRIEILEASARGFNGAGTIGVLLEGAGAPGISNLDLAVQLRDYAITNLPIPIPEAITVAGTTDFDGRVSGTIDALRVAGNLGLNNFAVNDAVFEPRLTGDFLYASNQRIDLNVAGARDRIAVNLDGQNRPQSFYVQWKDAIAEGRGEGDRLVATVQNFPLEALNVAPASQLGLGEVAGTLNGRFNINLAELSNPSIVGELAVANPAIDYIKADSFTGKFRYFDGVGVLDDGELRRGGSRYLLAGTYNPYAETQFQGKITAEPGRIEDIFAALQWFQLTDLSRGIEPPTYATAASVDTEPVGNPNATILNQLRRYSEIVALRNLQIAQREEAEFLPDLSTLQGAFSGDVNLAYSSKTGPKLDFALSGQDWQWGKYQVNQVIAQGGFDNGILTLRPVLLQSDDSVLKFTGQVGGEEQSGQLIAQNIPLEALRDLFKLPLDIEGGTLSANAFLSGSLGNPQVLGEVLLTDATLNKVDAPPFRTLFGYSNARLEVESRVVDDEQDTFRFTGSIPYRFPFMTVAPASNAFNLNLNIRNEGLALVSLFTDQIAWKGGEGDVQLQVNGAIDTTSQDQPKLSQISALGEATIQDATIGSRTLPEDITNVNGNIVFNTDRIQVQTLQGQFSNGELVAQGTLPLLVPLSRQNPEAEVPLTLSLNNLRLDLKNLYRGGVDGQVLLLGTALSPVISGDIRMHDGSVYIPDQASPTTTASTETGAPALPGIINPPELQDFRVVLGDRLRVVKEPLLNFLVAGDFLLNGTQDDLRPDGTINLLSGQVNLFTTQFYLSRDHDNVAIFTPSRGLDPFLDVKLVASVPEVTRAPAQTSSLNSSEIADTPAFEYGALQTIRVEASVNGPASQIYNNLELTSSPRRSEAEIVALIGGSFVNTLGQGNATTAIANLAGATLLTGLQNFITDATGLTDFRLFPTNVLSDDERSSALALGAELGVDITDRFSVSVLQILTAEDATRFNLRYRLTDQLTLRGSADTDGNSQAVLEFVTQF